MLDRSPHDVKPVVSLCARALRVWRVLDLEFRTFSGGCWIELPALVFTSSRFMHQRLTAPPAIYIYRASLPCPGTQVAKQIDTTATFAGMPAGIWISASAGCMIELSRSYLKSLWSGMAVSSMARGWRKSKMVSC